MDAKQQAARLSLLVVSGLLFGAAGSAWMSSQSQQSTSSESKSAALPIRKVQEVQAAVIPAASAVVSQDSGTPATSMLSATLAARQSAGRRDPSAPIDRSSSTYIASSDINYGGTSS